MVLSAGAAGILGLGFPTNRCATSSQFAFFAFYLTTLVLYALITSCVTTFIQTLCHVSLASFGEPCFPTNSNFSFSLNVILDLKPNLNHQLSHIHISNNGLVYRSSGQKHSTAHFLTF